MSPKNGPPTAAGPKYRQQFRTVSRRGLLGRLARSLLSPADIAAR
jgi:hypothetical protein